MSFKYSVIGDKTPGRCEYNKPEVLAKSTTKMANCRPTSKPAGRPCNFPGGPGGH